MKIERKKEIGLFLIGILFILFIIITCTTIEKKNDAKLSDTKKIEEKKNQKKEEKQESKKDSISNRTTEEEQKATTDSNVSVPDTKVEDETVVEYQKTDSDVISYFQSVDAIVVGQEEDISLREKLKNNVHIINQFLFHDGTIQGKTFHELSNDAKLQVLKIALSIDNKIDTYFPNYKDTIKESVSNLKGKIITIYLETTNEICSNHEEICESARSDFNNMKDHFKITFSVIKDLAKSGSSAIKEWYYSVKD